MQTTRLDESTKTKSSNSKTVLIILLIVMALLILGICGYCYYILNLDTAYKGVCVDGISIEGFLKEDTIEQVSNQRQKELDKINLKIVHEDKSWDFCYSDINASYNIDEIVDKAYEVGKNGSVVERLKEIIDVSRNGKEFTTTFSYNTDNLNSEIGKIAKELNIEPVDATIDFDPDREEMFAFTEEVIGKGILVKKTVDEVEQIIENWSYDEPYKLPYEVLNPKYTLEELKTWTDKIASYGTDLHNSSSARRHNIKLSSASYDGIRIEPGETFSLNEATGPRDLKAGYKNAPVIVNGNKLEDQPGGGNCQTSTTLYGAVMRADLEVVERWNHSWPSHYTEVGQDATVNYPTADIKFKNKKETPIFINRYFSNNHIYVEIYGKKSEEFDKINIVSVVTATTEVPEYKETVDQSMEPGTEEIEIKSRRMIKVQTYRVYYKDGKEIKREKEAFSHYPRIVGRKKVGPEPEPEPDPQPDPNEGNEGNEEN